MSSSSRFTRHAAVIAAALLSTAGLTPAASATAASATTTPTTAAPTTAAPTTAAQLGAYWTPARMAAALPADTTSPALTAPPTADGPRPGEFIPPSRSFDGIPQAGAFFWTDVNGTGRTCSASVVHSPDHDLVLSAGHCLKGYAGPSPRRNLGFVPQYHDGLKPFGVFPVKADGIYLAQEYYDRGEHAGAAYDFGFAVTEPNQDGRPLEDATGAVRLLTDTGYVHAPVRMIGYPGGAQKPLECLSWTTRWAGDDPADPGTFERIVCDGFTGGTSGGPMLIPWFGGWAVIGLVGGYHTGGNTPQVSYSAPFTSAIRALYEAATTGAPPAAPAP
ncbi:trypsin-like serine peptidase [Streptomyces sp. CBMA123]|uniref:trypsin-like serine peptidase n=1 Tax=Streptomyces sp. CBMA123 TaxID=1896313 RepID=UPI001661EF1F|nr:hypothetical protein [Streptomyces sp. CBMA123]MBD0695329.1 hypothetical protein [Streptomyces sp. CBMA123]